MMKRFMNIFEWDDWDYLGGDIEIYLDCELLRDVGKYKKGYEFSAIYFHKRNMTLEFYECDQSDSVMFKRFVLEEE